MKRITPEEVVEAFAKINMKPCRFYMNATHSCCGIGAIAIANGVRDPEPYIVSKIRGYIDAIYGTAYRRGFEVGFDGPYSPNDGLLSDYEIGQLDGYNAAKAVGL